MQKDLTDKAIRAALEHDWSQAITLNLSLLTQDSQNVSALNRLGKAYSESGDLVSARSTYETVLSLDKFNTIAQKALTKLTHQTSATSGTRIKTCLNFVEEPGKTKSIPLIHLGDPKIICRLTPGEIVNLVAKNHTLSVETSAGDHLGVFTDDVAYRLRPCLEAGNIYLVTVRTASTNQVIVFMREVSREAQFQTPTFS